MRLFAVTLTLLSATTFSEAANADDTQKRSPELQVLERFIGNWETVVTNKSTGTKERSVETKKWSKGGKFVLSEDTTLPEKRESHFMITYDPNGEVYRSCLINSGSVTTILGTWDEKTRTMNWNGNDFAGNKLKGWSRFNDKDNSEWSMVITNSDGEILAELTAKVKRRKK